MGRWLADRAFHVAVMVLLAQTSAGEPWACQSAPIVNTAGNTATATQYPSCEVVGFSARVSVYNESMSPAGKVKPLNVGYSLGGAAAFSFRNIMRSFYNVSWTNDKNKVAGHVITLGSHPSRHFTVMEPKSGCGSGRGDPVFATANAYEKHRVFVAKIPCDTRSDSYLCGATKPTQRVFVTSSVYGCRVASNAGLYNTRTYECYGALVQDGVVKQAGEAMLPSFAVDADNAAVLGYLSPDTAERNGRILQQVSGLGWLVRDSKSFIDTGIPLSVENAGIQESGSASRFFEVASGRTCVGINTKGELMIAQIDGRSDWLGVDLSTFSNWAVEMGFLAAINLDGGASCTLVRDGMVVNVPSYSCKQPDAYYEAAGARGLKEGDTPVGDDPNYKCVRSVSSILCIHDDPVMPLQDTTTHQLVVDSGCICYQPYSTAQPLGFESKDILTMVKLGGGKGRALTDLLEYPHAEVMRALAGQAPARNSAARSLSTDGSLCMCTQAPSNRKSNTVWETEARIRMPADDAPFQILYLSRRLPHFTNVEVNYDASDILDSGNCTDLTLSGYTGCADTPHGSTDKTLDDWVAIAGLVGLGCVIAYIRHKRQNQNTAAYQPVTTTEDHATLSVGSLDPQIASVDAPVPTVDVAAAAPIIRVNRSPR
jgi:hypothetical protein